MLLSKEDDITPKLIFDAAIKGNSIADRVINQYIEYLSEGLANMLSVFQPEVVAIGGGISNQGENLLKLLAPAMKGKVFGEKYVETSKIKLAEAGADAGIIGAAMLMMNPV